MGQASRKRQEDSESRVVEDEPEDSEVSGELHLDSSQEAQNDSDALSDTDGSQSVDLNWFLQAEEDFRLNCNLSLSEEGSMCDDLRDDSDSFHFWITYIRSQLRHSKIDWECTQTPEPTLILQHVQLWDGNEAATETWEMRSKRVAQFIWQKMSEPVRQRVTMDERTDAYRLMQKLISLYARNRSAIAEFYLDEFALRYQKACEELLDDLRRSERDTGGPLHLALDDLLGILACLRYVALLDAFRCPEGLDFANSLWPTDEDEFLCTICKNWDIRESLQNTTATLKTYPFCNDLRGLLESALYCPLCRLLVHTVVDDPDLSFDPDMPEGDYTWTANYRAELVVVPQILGTVEKEENGRFQKRSVWGMGCKLIFGVIMDPDTIVSGDIRLVPPYVDHGFQLLADIEEDGDSTSMLRGRRRGEALNWDLLRRWVGICEKCHSLCVPQPTTFSFPFRVIDVFEYRVVTNPQCDRYAALSYVWGTAPMLKLTKSNLHMFSQRGALGPTSVLSTPVPMTIRDAITVCQNIGVRFLWVDALCIIQDSDEDKAQQIGAMDKVYGAASLTIVASTGANANAGLAGVRPTFPRPTQRRAHIQGMDLVATGPWFVRSQQACIWNKRGWTFQEKLLSKRLLIFSDDQCFYHCDTSIFYEDICTEPSRSCVVDLVDTHTPLLERQLKTICGSLGRSHNEHSELKAYTTSVSAYVERNLTFDSDAVAAFQGMFNILEQSLGSFWWGLPLSEFARCLSWGWTPNPTQIAHGWNQGVRLQCPRIRTEFPSWSWLSQTPVISKNPVPSGYPTYSWISKGFQDWQTADFVAIPGDLQVLNEYYRLGDGGRGDFEKITEFRREDTEGLAMHYLGYMVSGDAPTVCRGNIGGSKCLRGKDALHLHHVLHFDRIIGFWAKCATMFLKAHDRGISLTTMEEEELDEPRKTEVLVLATPKGPLVGCMHVRQDVMDEMATPSRSKKMPDLAGSQKDTRAWFAERMTVKEAEFVFVSGQVSSQGQDITALMVEWKGNVCRRTGVVTMDGSEISKTVRSEDRFVVME